MIYWVYQSVVTCDIYGSCTCSNFVFHVMHHERVHAMYFSGDFQAIRMVCCDSNNLIKSSISTLSTTSSQLLTQEQLIMHRLHVQNLVAIPLMNIDTGNMHMTCHINVTYICLNFYYRQKL
ncbi:hypothetical protein KP509_1Z224700 [Ceratopteris richardii]|nr:hypothetical protein KP509_1Z224700 [Ceratopteris richardii]